MTRMVNLSLRREKTVNGSPQQRTANAIECVAIDETTRGWALSDHAISSRRGSVG